NGRKRSLPVLGAAAARLAREAQRGQALDLALALQPGGVSGGQRRDQLGDAVAQLQREVGGRGAHQRPDVLHGDLAVGAGALGVLGLAHWLVGGSIGLISRRESRWAWTAVERARSSPMTQA